ncbi:MAG: hypothetical protein ABIT05_01285 [Chitinophagaceae bacterium]
MIGRYKYLIGIDCGVQTGLCVWSRWDKNIRTLTTVKIHTAMEAVKGWHNTNPGEVKVRVEDARKRKWFGKSDREQLQGAGSIKRDAKIWEDFLSDIGVDFEMVPPKNNKTKMADGFFKKVTGHTGSTTEHSRDAAMLVYGL